MPTQHQKAADTVLAHLVSLRGGAPFLSPTDARLLMGWLNAGVPVPLLLHALEQCAEKRRDKRLRTPLSLSAVKKAVTQWKGGEKKAPAPPQGALAPLIKSLHAKDRVTYALCIQALSALEGQGQALAVAALEISRGFFERAWAQGDREALLDQARAELEPLRSQVKPSRYEQLTEEVARDLLRQAHPLLSATRIWDTVGM